MDFSEDKFFGSVRYRAEWKPFELLVSDLNYDEDIINSSIRYFLWLHEVEMYLNIHCSNIKF